MLYDVATLTVRVVPRSSRAGVERRGDEIVVHVNSPPVGGRANQEVRRLLAEALDVPRSALTVRSGARSRTKILDVTGLTGVDLRERVERFAAASEA